MHGFFVFLAFFGLAYGAFTMHAIGWRGKDMDKHIERDEKDIDREAAGRGARAAAFRLVKPLYLLLSLPMKAPLGALFLAFLMIVPMFIF